MKVAYVFFCLIFSITFVSCATVRQSKEQRKEVEDSIESIAEGLTGKDLSKDEVKRLERQIREDKETQEVIEVISDTMQKPQQIKFCPQTGKRYSSNLEICPTHNVPLDILTP